MTSKSEMKRLNALEGKPMDAPRSQHNKRRMIDFCRCENFDGDRPCPIHRNAYIIENEWRKLKAHLSEEQLMDSRRTFYCGALQILAMHATGDLNIDTLAKLHTEIADVLKYRDVFPEGTQADGVR